MKRATITNPPAPSLVTSGFTPRRSTAVPRKTATVGSVLTSPSAASARPRSPFAACTATHVARAHPALTIRAALTVEATDAPSHSGRVHWSGVRELEPAFLLVLPDAVGRGHDEQSDRHCREHIHRPHEAGHGPEVAEAEATDEVLHVRVLGDVGGERAGDASDDEARRDERETPTDEPAEALPPLEPKGRLQETGTELSGVALGTIPSPRSVLPATVRVQDRRGRRPTRRAARAERGARLRTAAAPRASRTA